MQAIDKYCETFNVIIAYRFFHTVYKYIYYKKITLSIHIIEIIRFAISILYFRMCFYIVNINKELGNYVQIN